MAKLDINNAIKLASDEIKRHVMNNLTGKELYYLLEEFRIKKRIHVDDFDDLFVKELLKMLEEESE